MIAHPPPLARRPGPGRKQQGEALMRDPNYVASAGFDSVFQNSLGDAMAAGRWQDLVANMGADVAESVRGSLTSITELLQSKRIGPSEALWLPTPLKRLYQAGRAGERRAVAAHRGAHQGRARGAQPQLGRLACAVAARAPEGREGQAQGRGRAHPRADQVQPRDEPAFGLRGARDGAGRRR